jgi:hypothetical protein
LKVQAWLSSLQPDFTPSDLQVRFHSFYSRLPIYHQSLSNNFLIIDDRSQGIVGFYDVRDLSSCIGTCSWFPRSGSLGPLKGTASISSDGWIEPSHDNGTKHGHYWVAGVHVDSRFQALQRRRRYAAHADADTPHHHHHHQTHDDYITIAMIIAITTITITIAITKNIAITTTKTITITITITFNITIKQQKRQQRRQLG